VIRNNTIGLSPMDGVTDAAFRLVQCEIAKPDLIYTEFVSAEGLSHKAKKLLQVLKFSPQERPILAQLFGKTPESFGESAQLIHKLGFDGLDINLGCPAKQVTRHGSGAALIEKPELVKKIIKAVKKNLPKNYPVSVKTRLGIDQSIVDQWIPFLIDCGVDMIALHGRTLKQGYSGQADWEEVAKAAVYCQKANIPILGNGDIQNRQQGEEYCEKYNLNGVLIGRAAMGNPWVFNNHIPTPKEKFQTALLHAQYFEEIFPKRRFDSMRKHFLLYTLGLPNAKKLRSKIVKVNSIKDFLSLEEEFINC
jgi:nifR3 family TIM-barrel protein